MAACSFPFLTSFPSCSMFVRIRCFILLLVFLVLPAAASAQIVPFAFWGAGTCAGGTVTWSTYCSGPVGALSSGVHTGVTNTATGYTGSVTVTCNNGTLSQSGASCSASCGGTLVGGYCWYAAATGASCDTGCTGHGGYNSATLNYAGYPAGSDANCLAVLNALSVGSGSIYDALPTGCAAGEGCGLAVLSSKRIRDNTATTNSSSSCSGTTQRVCACNN